MNCLRTSLTHYNIRFQNGLKNLVKVPSRTFEGAFGRLSFLCFRQLSIPIAIECMQCDWKRKLIVSGGCDSPKCDGTDCGAHHKCQFLGHIDINHLSTQFGDVL